MGKLNIAHHKSYHPYRRDNVERVRRDEEEARQKEAVEEGRMMLADSEARIDLLRQRAGLQGSKSRKDKDKDKDDVDAQIAAAARERVDGAESGAAPGPSTTLTSRTGHINLFEDLEQQSMAVPVRSTKRGPPPPPPPKGESERETEKGVALAPSAKDLNPWYSDRHHGHDADGGPEVDNKRLRDLARKSTHDPLTAINSRLASRDGRPPPPPPAAAAAAARSRQPPRPAGSRAGGAARGGDGGGGGGGSGSGAASASAERTSRESAERLRALELVRRRKREMGGSETPGTVRGGGHGSGSGSGTGDYGYGDVFNRRAVEEAHSRDKARRGWRDRDGRDGGGGRERERDRYGARGR